jgi:hypothetical protein
VDSRHVHGGVHSHLPHQLIMPLDSIIASATNKDVIHIEYKPSLDTVAASSEEFASIYTDLFGQGLCGAIAVTATDDFGGSGAPSGAIGTDIADVDATIFQAQHMDTVLPVNAAAESGDRSWHWASSTPNFPGLVPHTDAGASDPPGRDSDASEVPLTSAASLQPEVKDVAEAAAADVDVEAQHPAGNHSNYPSFAAIGSPIQASPAEVAGPTEAQGKAHVPSGGQAVNEQLAPSEAAPREGKDNEVHANGPTVLLLPGAPRPEDTISQLCCTIVAPYSRNSSAFPWPRLLLGAARFP